METVAPVSTEQIWHFSATDEFRNLVKPALYGRITCRIAKNEGVEIQLAEEILDAALGFLYLSATKQGLRLSPSPLVDIGWHTFILYTKDYAEFCNQVAGRFIHHEPNDIPDAAQKPGGVSRTIEQMKAAGLPYNEMLWLGQPNRRKFIEIFAGGDCNADCDDGGGGPGDECTCS